MMLSLSAAALAAWGLVAAADPGAALLAVLPPAGKGLTVEQADFVGETFVTAAEDVLGVRVVGPADVLDALSAAERPQARKCDAAACMTELGAPLGATWVLSVRVNRADGKMIVSLKLGNVDEGNIVARVQKVVGGDEVALVEAAPDIMRELKARLQGSGTAAVAPAPRSPQPKAQSAAPAPTQPPASAPKPAATPSATASAPSPDSEAAQMEEMLQEGKAKMASTAASSQAHENDVIVLRDGRAVLGKVVDYAVLSIKVVLAPQEDMGGLKLTFFTDPRDFPMSVEEARKRFDEQREVILPLGHVQSIQWGPEPTAARPQIEAVLAGLAVTESAFYDLDLNVDPAAITKPIGAADFEATTQTQLTIGPSGRLRVEHEEYGYYADGRFEVGYDDPGGDLDATKTVTIAGAVDPFAAGNALEEDEEDTTSTTETFSLDDILAQVTNAPPDVSRQGVKRYLGFGKDVFLYGEHELYVENVPAADGSGDNETGWYSGVTLGAGMGRLMNITGEMRLKMVERYLREVGLIDAAGLPEGVRLRLRAIYDGRALPSALARETFAALQQHEPPVLVRPPTATETLELLEVLQDAFIEREQGLEIKAGLKVDLHPFNGGGVEDPERQYGFGVGALYERVLDEQTQLSAVGFYYANKLKLFVETVLLGNVEVTRRYSQALTAKLFSTLALLKTGGPSDDDGDDATFLFFTPGGSVIYSVLDRVSLRGDAALVYAKASFGGEDAELTPGYQLMVTLSYDLY